MIRIENIDVYGFESAIRGMRNPLNSWDKSDSFYCGDVSDCNSCRFDDVGCSHIDYGDYVIGENDIDLMQRLFKGGTEHRKFMRMINVTMDITAHHTWWSEFDTYKVGTVRNSCSKMHKIHVKEFVKDDFSTEGIDECGGRTVEVFEIVKDELERLRKSFNETKEKKYWRAIIELLPMGYNIRATVQMNYEVAYNIIKQRKGHKLNEWHELAKVLLNLPYMKEIIGVME